VARNRKRAKDRRATRRPNAGNGARRITESDPEVTPSPLEHAAPDVELAEAQLEVGRPQPDDDDFDLSAEAEAEEREEELEDAGGGFNGEPPSRIGGGRGVRGDGGRAGGGGGGGAAAGAVPLAQPRPAGLLARLIGFLQGSWRELQRVQWPDRRQVAQATGVVIGFVIVAGVFLGLCDLAFSHLMNYILK
jgi:preprotein translocase subunit SecE